MPIILTNPIKPSSGAFQFTFTNTSGVSFHALATTNSNLVLEQLDRDWEASRKSRLDCSSSPTRKRPTVCAVSMAVPFSLAGIEKRMILHYSLVFVIKGSAWKRRVAAAMAMRVKPIRYRRSKPIAPKPVFFSTNCLNPCTA